MIQLKLHRPILGAAVLWLLAAALLPAAAAPTIVLSQSNRVITESCRVKKGVYVLKDTDESGAVRIDADNITVDFGGATITTGDASTAKLDKLQGFGISISGHKNVTIKNAVVQGYKRNICAVNCPDLGLENCETNYSKAERLIYMNGPAHSFLWVRNINEWRGYGTGIWIEKSDNTTVTKCKSLYAQNGLLIVDSNKCLVHNNDFSYNSGWGLGLRNCSDNVISWNLADYVNRCIGGILPGLDSTSFLLNDSCNRNYFVGNSITNGGDGFFLANYSPDRDEWKVSELSPHASNENIVAYNDGSWAPANAFECTFASGNIFYKNWANDCNYGFWMGLAEHTDVIGTEVKRSRFEGMAIPQGHGNRIEGNTFANNTNSALHVWADETDVSKVHPSKDYEVTGNTFENEKKPIDITFTTNLYLGDNTFKNCQPPTDLKIDGKPAATSATKRFESSPQYAKVQQILATRPKDFKYFRETEGPFGMEWFQLNDYAPRDPRGQLAAYRPTGWGSSDFYVYDPTKTKLKTKGSITVGRDAKNPNLFHVMAAKPAAGVAELSPCQIILTKGRKTQTVARDFLLADWKLRWFRWDKTAPKPQSGDPAAIEALFNGTPAVEQTVSDVTWGYKRPVPKEVADGPCAVEASTQVKLPAGNYYFTAGAYGEVRLLIDGKQQWYNWNMWELGRPQKPVHLDEGIHRLTIQYLRESGLPILRPFWGWTPGEPETR